MKTKAYFNWSSGKDSALALYRALNRFDIKALLTVIDSTNNRIPMHGTNLDLLKAQSQSIGIPLVTCDIKTEYSEDKYKISLQTMMLLSSVHKFVFSSRILKQCAKKKMLRSG